MGAGSIYVPGYSLYGAPNGLSGLSCCDNSSWQTVQAQQAQLNAQLAASNAALNAMQAQLQASVNYLNQQMAQQVAGAAIIQQVGYNGMPQGTAASVQQQQQVMQAIMNVYPGASYAESAQQAYKNGEYGKATFYGTETVVDSIAALLGSKVIGAGIAGVGRLIGRGVEGVDALTRAGRAASGAESAAQGANLAEHLRQLEEYGAAGSKELQNGRIRYFDEIDAAKTPGEMAGRRVVREWARGKSMETPTRIEVEAKLSDLLAGKASREDVSEWAERWVRMSNSNVRDPQIWKALKRLSGADLISTDRPYLYDQQDFDLWLRDFRE